ncbi:MAG TPA: tetratricopeptide repeat protein [Pyrinomonadaceae bacterium]|jgi:tetratricopeptide (TPR) repeat protein
MLGIDVEGDSVGHKRLEELLLLFPKELAHSKTGLRRLAHAQSEQQNYDAALQTLQRVVGLGAEAWDYTSMARAHRSARRPAQALAAADQAVKLDAEYADAHFERACALAQLGRMREAVVALKRALELDPELGESLDSNDRKLVESLPDFKKLLEEKSAEDESPATQRSGKTGEQRAPQN